MTIYHAELTLPIDGAINQQTTLEIKVNEGILADFYVVFPGGHAGLTNARILQEGSQIIPWNNLNYLTGDNISFRFNPGIEIIGGGIPLIFSGYNLDDTYPHTVYFDFDVQPQVDAARRGLRERLGL